MVSVPIRTVIFRRLPDELDSFAGDVVLAVISKEERPLRGASAWLDWRLYGTISDLILRRVFEGELGEKCLLPTYGKFAFDRVVLLGAGELSMNDPSHSEGAARWKEIFNCTKETLELLKVESAALALPRIEIPDQERAILKLGEEMSITRSFPLIIPRAREVYSVQ